MMSTPAPTSVASVREKRAIATFRTVSPILNGTRSLNLSHMLPTGLGALGVAEAEDDRR